MKSVLIVEWDGGGPDVFESKNDAILDIIQSNLEDFLTSTKYETNPKRIEELVDDIASDTQNLMDYDYIEDYATIVEAGFISKEK